MKAQEAIEFSPQPPMLRTAPTRLRSWRGGLAAIALLLAYLATGFYLVQADEHGVVRRFGAVSARVGPGMHYRIPWPVDRVDVLKTTSVMKIGVGYTLSSEDTAPAGIELLTGDTNIVSIAMIVQYVVGNPADYLFNIQDPQVRVSKIAESVLTETVASLPVDEVLTTGRLTVQNQVKTKTQAILDRDHSGIQISSANIMAITFNGAVAQAFQEVADAMADREKVQNEARAYANDQIPKARADAVRLVSDAESYQQQRIAEATGNTERFIALLKEYEKAPAITRQRIYLEAMEKILPKVKMFVVDSQNGRVPVNLRVTHP